MDETKTEEANQSSGMNDQDAETPSPSVREPSSSETVAMLVEGTTAAEAMPAASRETAAEESSPDTDTNTDMPTATTANNTINNEPDHMSQLQQIWKDKGKEHRDEAIQETWTLISHVVNDLIQDGIAAHQELERVTIKLKTVAADCVSKAREIERLRAADKKSRESIANLLRAVGNANEETKDGSQAKLVEARMRADLLHVTSMRDQAQLELVESKRRCVNLSSELTQVKAKFSRLEQEKLQAERDQRATLALAKSLQGNNHSELDYYKRRSAELQTQIQGLTAVLTEKNSQIEQVRRQYERTMSQNRLAAYRSAESKKRTS